MTNRTVYGGCCPPFHSQFSGRAAARGRRQLLWLVYGLFLVAGVAQAAIVPLLPRLAGAVLRCRRRQTGAAAGAARAGHAGRVGAGRAWPPTGSAPARRRWPPARCCASPAWRRRCRRWRCCCRAGSPSGWRSAWCGRPAWPGWRRSTPPAGGSRLGPSVTCSSVGVMVGPASAACWPSTTGVGVPFLLIALVAAAVVGAAGAGSGPRPRPPRPRACRAAAPAARRAAAAAEPAPHPPSARRDLPASRARPAAAPPRRRRRRRRPDRVRRGVRASASC